MADDARISTALPEHPKCVKLRRRLGDGAGWSLVCLFLFAAGNRFDGNLSGMTGEDIEIAAKWTGAEGVFISALVDIRFLDGEDGSYSIHDWSEHNPFAATKQKRIEAAREANRIRWEREKQAKGMRSVSESDAGRIEPDSPPPLTTPHHTKPTTTVRQKKSKQFSFDGYHPDTSAVCNYLAPKWPEKRGDGKPVKIDKAQFADRVDYLLRNGFTAEQLTGAADMYLAEKPEFASCPQFFFGKKDDAKYLAYTKMLIYQQQKAVTA